jgi:cellobiose-specific phosphotransferase system component IIC
VRVRSDDVEEISSEITVLSIMLLNVMTEQRLVFRRMIYHHQIAEIANYNVAWYSTAEVFVVMVLGLLQVWVIRW